MKMFIGGEWIDKEQKIEVYNPYTNKLIDVVPKADISDVRKAISSLAQYDQALSSYERYEILNNAAAMLKERKKEFQNLISSESGMSLKDSSKEVDRSCNILILAAEEAKRIQGEYIPLDIIKDPKARFAITVMEPVGVICAITPFNRPLNQVVVKIAPAIAANNSIIVKPSEKTPLSAILFGELLLKCGLPLNMLSIITGDPNEIGQELLTNEDINMITFTGSINVGKTIASMTKIKKLMLELGGNNVLIVEEDADLNQAANLAAAGAFGNAGQSCRGVKRILVFESIADAFASKLVENAKKLRCGDPFNVETDVGSLIDEEAAKKVQKRVEDAISDGAKLLFGGMRQGACIPPTVLDNVNPSSKLVTEETFGPVAPIIRVKSLDQAIEITNATDYGLQSGIMTQNINKAFYYAKRIRAGAVNINQGPQHDSPNIPFGGVKNSGIGREGIKFAIQEMTNLKTIVINYQDSNA